jgi:hypothetical protein
MSGVDSAGDGYTIVEGAGLPRIQVIGFRRRVDWPTLVDRLEADAAGWYRLLAAAWFTAAAVPQTTLAAAEVERRGRPAAAWATLLGWPLVVAAVLAPNSAAAVERLVSVGGLATSAVALTLLSAGLRRAGASRETALAVALAAAMAGGLMLRESGYSCETRGLWQGSPVVRGVVSCKEVHVPAGFAVVA